MIWFITASIIIGFGLGFVLPASLIINLSDISEYALAILLFGIGMDLGSNRKIWQGLKEKGLKVLLIPLAITIGTLGSTGLVAPVIGLQISEGAAVGAGFGWYSLSGVMLADLHSAELGAMAFLTNIFRELIAVLFMPVLAKYLGFLSPIAAGGATSMDTTLPLISSVTDQQTTLYAFITGAVLSTLVPILVPILIGL